MDSPDSMLLYLLNANGEIQIEDKIFRIDGDFVYTYIPGYGKKIDEFIEAYMRGDIKIEDGKTVSFRRKNQFTGHSVKECATQFQKS